jgi:YesN/AraC family two-component response regulator
MILRTIVVDDEQLAREELCFQLQRIAGVDVVGEASNGMEALRVVAERQPDLVFLDVQMPGLSGFEVARRLAAQARAPRLVSS